jgi:hypothetical protein
MVTFEKTDALVESAVAFRASGTSPAAAAQAGPMASVCAAYAVLRPILKAIEAFPLIPAKWKKIIDEFIAVMDAICPQPAAAGLVGAGQTFEAIDTQVGNALVVLLQAPPPASHVAMGAIAGDIPKICAAYKSIKPILDFVKQFLPAKLALAITLAEQVLDAICKTT